MLDRLKIALVDSFAGAIAIGFLFAEGIQRVAYIFSEPVIRWLLQWSQMHRNSQFPVPYQYQGPPRFPLEMAIPQLFTALFLLGASYILLRWLYFPPPEIQAQNEPPEQE